MTHTSLNLVLILSLLIWAGACMGANMIAAPAKFEVIDLTRPVALQVGRMQFQWVGFLECILALLAGIAVITAPARVKILVAVAILFFASQRLIILPQLSNRTDQIINGVSAEGSHLHICFIVFELIKIVTIISGAVFALSAMSLRPESN